MKRLKSYKVACAGLLMMIAATVSGAEKVTVKFWHSQRGAREKVLRDLIDKFNQKNENINVEMMFQGSYEETLNKYRSTLNTSESPNMIMIYDIGTRAMIDSETIIPVQKFMDKDTTFDKNDFPAQIKDYYSLNDTMYSIPLGSSTAIMYYNKDLFKAAGLNPENPPKSYKEVEEYSKKLVKIENGKTVTAGMIYSTDPWPVEQYLANNNADYVNENNGRSGVATQVAYVNDTGKVIFGWMKNMLKEGTANYYTNAKDGDAAFMSGKGAIYVQTSAVLSEIKANSPFELGIAYLPNISGNFNGSMVGGNSLWVTKFGTEKEQEASWEVLKYVSSPEFQAYWSINTGYVPTNKKSYTEANFKEHVAKYPESMVAINQLNDSKATAATSGASFGSFPEARANMKVGMEKLFSTNITVDKMLEEISGTTNKDIRRYNTINKKK